MSRLLHKYLLLTFGLTFIFAEAQLKEDFDEEVAQITQKYNGIRNSEKQTVVFTGSSSIRLWEDLQSLFPEYQVVNTGFGGSRASDLLNYSDNLILRYNPRLVFIYEGDNDISDRKRPVKIVSTTEAILQRIWQHDPSIRVILISAKPSPLRWHLRRRYKKLNRHLLRLAEKTPGLEFANIWNVMLKDKKVDATLFVEDGLHMNKKGYDLWYSVLKLYLQENQNK